MPYRFNPFLGNLDYYQTSTGGDVVGPASATDKAIARYDGTTGKLIQDSPYSIIQDGGTVQAQAFAFNRQILNDVTIPDHYSAVSSDVELISGDIILLGDAQLILL